jgi:hypothetical protein
MAVKPTGGPAFPTDPSRYKQFPGMDLRDYFAAQALPALITFAGTASGVEATKEAMKLVVESAYAMADDMIAERNRT